MQPMLHKLLVSAMFVCAGTSLWAQTVRGTILGTVTDPSGAVVHKAKVTVREVATGLTRSELTSETGEYSIPQLPVGIYDLTVEEPSFKKTERPGIELRVDDRLRIDVALTLGNVAETVQVEAAAPVVSTDSATVGNVVDNKKVTELPLNGRNFLQLNLLVPGATQGVKGSQNQTQGGSITVNGAREESNNFLLDGMDNNDLADQPVRGSDLHRSHTRIQGASQYLLRRVWAQSGRADQHRHQGRQLQPASRCARRVSPQ